MYQSLESRLLTLVWRTKLTSEMNSKISLEHQSLLVRKLLFIQTILSHSVKQCMWLSLVWMSYRLCNLCIIHNILKFK